MNFFIYVANPYLRNFESDKIYIHCSGKKIKEVNEKLKLGSNYLVPWEFSVSELW